MSTSGMSKPHIAPLAAPLAGLLLLLGSVSAQTFGYSRGWTSTGKGPHGRAPQPQLTNPYFEYESNAPEAQPFGYPDKLPLNAYRPLPLPYLRSARQPRAAPVDPAEGEAAGAFAFEPHYEAWLHRAVRDASSGQAQRVLRYALRPASDGSFDLLE